MASKNIITEIKDRNLFMELLNQNPGLIIIKFGAEWCKPCKKIAPVIDAFFATTPKDVLCANLDIDKEGNIDVYSFLKFKKMVQGIPVLLCYKKKSSKENVTYIPDDTVVGANSNDLNDFFKRCGAHLEDVKRTIPKNNGIKI